DKIMCVKGDKISAFGTPDEIFGGGMINELYGIENGSYDPLLGSVELERASGEPEIFVVGGAGSGIPFYRSLQKEGIPFAAGILFENDIDYRVADALAVKVISCAPFERITEREAAAALELIGRVPYVADCGCAAGEFNRPNALLIDKAREAGKKIITVPDGLRELRAYGN
ncbi:MAG: ABC transporter ATP-binding protein, partial [Eubacteriales bacterium]